LSQYAGPQLSVRNSFSAPKIRSTLNQADGAVSPELEGVAMTES